MSMGAGIYGAILGVMSVVTFCFYASDKSRAKKRAWRIPEKVLLLLSVFGGAAGGFLAMYGLRHKTRHWYFVAVNVVFLVLQIAGLLWFCGAF